MARRMLILVLLFFIGACDNTHDQKQDRKIAGEILARTVYDTGVIRHISLYDSLRKILIPNLDTIFKFRNKRDGDRNEFCLFRYNWEPPGDTSGDKMGPGTMPAFIYPAVQHIFEVLGKDRIRDLMLWSDGTIEIRLPVSHIDETTNEAVMHQLRYKRENERLRDPFIKDSIVAPGWIYQLVVPRYEDDL